MRCAWLALAWTVLGPPAQTIAQEPPPQAPVDGYEVVRVYPHDPDAFTQGLAYADGFIYEGTGLHGRSSLRRLDLESGRVLDVVHLPENLFGEGIATLDERIVQLTWRSGVGLVYDRRTLALIERFGYRHEGWGVAHDGRHLIVSDGTEVLRALDPRGFGELRRLRVSDGGRAVGHLNELEYVDGEIFANVWLTERIARISPITGRVNRWIDLHGLRATAGDAADVLNGIAYDRTNRRLFVTGKLWSRLYEIRIVEGSP